uniref:Phosphotransferase n=1 Tax=Schlesneria paludicola TaxID=360056 RepID=A0A7C4QS80_9PLAN
MRTLSAENVVEYLRETGRLPADAAATVTPLAWGVSNIVLRIEPAGHRPLVVKQAQPQLRTRQEWFSRCERIYREADALRAWQTLLPPQAVPEVVFEDRPRYILGLEAIRSDHVVWKQRLLEGRLDHLVAHTLGQRMAAIHRGSWRRPDLLPGAEDWSVFEELRIDPFYRQLTRVYPELHRPIQEVIDDMAAHRLCLVHADFSPKNVLVHPQGITLVDFETAHYGDPAFDLGFFLSHLLLKSLLHPAQRRDWRALVDEFLEEYEGGMPAEYATGIWRRAVRHLAACLWARIDGKSPVEYLTAPPLREFVRRVARDWLSAPPASVHKAVAEFLSRQI